MHSRYELWVIIFLQIVALEAQQPRPDLLEIILIMAALAMGKKVLLFMKEGRKYGNEYNQHTHHLYHDCCDLCNWRRQG